MTDGKAQGVLMPCPFCGGEAVMMREPDEDVISRYAQCNDCLAQTSVEQALVGRESEIPNLEKEAAEAWNTRAPSLALTEAREQNERLRELATLQTELIAIYQNAFSIRAGYEHAHNFHPDSKESEQRSAELRARIAALTPVTVHTREAQ